MNTCYMNKRRQNHYGFNMPKGFIYGNIDGIEYITNGNPKGGKMRLYIHNGNGWMRTVAIIKTSVIAKTVMERYGKIIEEKNAQYKDSMKEIMDRQEWKNKSYGQELNLRTSRPYDSTAPDAEYRIIKANNRERAMGL